MASQMEIQLADVLSATPVLLSNPGQNLINNELYSTPHNTKLDLINQLVTRGRTKISSNSLNFGATSTFQIPPSSFLSDCWISGQVTTPQYACAPSGWGLNAINRIFYQLSGNSSINNVSLNGSSHRDLVLFSCGTTAKRNAVLNLSPYINGTSAGSVNVFAIPIYLPWSSLAAQGVFPFDTSTLSSNIIVSIEWKPFYQIFSGQTGNAITGPLAFDNLNLKAKTVDLMDGYAFKISNIMNQDPSLTYAIPSLLTQTFDVYQNVTPGVQSSISLSSLPTGQLAFIMVTARPVSWGGDSTTTTSLIYPQSAEFSYLNLQYNGQDLIKYENYQEKLLGDLNDSVDSGFGYTYTNSASLSSGTATSYPSSLTIMQLTYDAEGMMLKKKYQHCPSYGGSVLVFNFNVNVTTLTPASAANYLFEFTYAFNAIYEVRDRASSVVI